LLERNRCRRRVDPDTVKLLVRTLRRGRWDLKSQVLPVQVDLDGYLVCGQTLLTAVAEAEVTVDMLVKPSFM
jgi:hypothetical protein